MLGTRAEERGKEGSRTSIESSRTLSRYYYQGDVNSSTELTQIMVEIMIIGLT